MLKKILLLALLPAIAFAEELPAPVKAIEKQGITIIKTFDAPGGMKGYLGKYQDMGVTIYLTPDGKHAISGYMYNEKGNQFLPIRLMRFHYQIDKFYLTTFVRQLCELCTASGDKK